MVRLLLFAYIHTYIPFSMSLAFGVAFLLKHYGRQCSLSACRSSDAAKWLWHGLPTSATFCDHRDDGVCCFCYLDINQYISNRIFIYMLAHLNIDMHIYLCKLICVYGEVYNLLFVCMYVRIF